MNAQTPPTPHSAWGWPWQALILLGICGLLFFAAPGQRSLWETDEARYAEIAREMVVSGDWVTPRLNYVKYFEKPVLPYWLIAISFKLFGVSAASARLMPAFFATLSVLLVFWLGRWMWDSRSGFFAGLCLATSLMFLVLARVLLVDMVLGAGLLVALLGAWAVRQGSGWGRYAFWLGCAMGFLSKGLLGPGLPLMVVGLFVALSGEWGLLRELLRLRGLVMFTLLCAPWLIMVSLANPEFPEFFFIDQNFGRLLTTKHQRYQPFYYYFLLLPGAFFPWVALLPWALWRLWPGQAWRAAAARPWLFLVVWFLAQLVLLSLSQSKMMHYALPMLPPLALFMGRPLASLWSWGLNAEPPAALRRSVGLLAGLVLAGGVALLLIPALDQDVSYDQAGALLLAGPLVMCALGLFCYQIRQRAWAVLAAPLGIFLVLFLFAMLGGGRLDEYRSLEGLVEPIRQELGPDDVLVSYGDYYHGAVFYSGRRVAVVGNWGELEFGRALDPEAKRWFVPDDAAFLRMLQNRQTRVLALGETSSFERLKAKAQAQAGLTLHEWKRVGDKSLFSNQRP